MPDSKITALASIGTGTDPANDPLVIVDVSDVAPGGMSATGTTKKVTLNQLLATSPTATLASATITGDLTVDTNVLKVDTTNNRVGIGTVTPATDLHIQAAGSASAEIRLAAAGGRSYNIGSTAGGYGSANNLIIYDITGSAERYRLDGSGNHFWNNVGGTSGTAMTLNSTGLGVGTSPTLRLELNSATNTTAGVLVRNQTTVCGFFGNEATYTGTGSSNNTVAAAYGANSFIIATNSVARFAIDSSGNVGIGVTPSAWGNLKVVQFSGGSSIGGGFNSNWIQANAYYDGADWRYIATAAATRLQHDNAFKFFTAPSGTAGNTITFTQAMTLDASGNLLVGTTGISPTINGSGAISAKGVAGITLQTVSALATDYTLPIGAFSGILTIRSNGGGGSAVWMLDPNAGAVQISNNIVGRTITFTFSGGSWKMQQTVGTVPSTYNYLVLSTQ